MNELFGNNKKLVIIIQLVIAIGLGLIKLSWGLGFLVGVLVSLLNVYLLEWQIDGMFFHRKFNKLLGILFYTLKSFIWLIPLVVAFFYPYWINIFSTAAGILFYKYLFYFITFTRSDKK